MKKIIRIIVGNSAYTDDSGFGYSALKVRDLKDNQLKKYTKNFLKWHLYQVSKEIFQMIV